MSSFVVDSSAWIEYFDGSKKGAKLKGLIESPDNRLFTSTVTMAELISERFIFNKI